MESKIRAMTADDKASVLEMMRIFYASPAVLSNGSEEIFSNDIDACTADNPYLEGLKKYDVLIISGRDSIFIPPPRWEFSLFFKFSNSLWT